MGLPLHGLRIFTAVVEQQSFTQAAAVLYISQPAVSKAVQELERQLALPLLERHNGKFRLTEAGNVLYRYARTIFDTERAAEEALQALRGLERGTLRIGASTTIATYLLPTPIARFHQRYPHIQVVLTSANTHEIAEQLANHQHDIAFVEGPIQHPQLLAIPWQTDDLVVIAAPEHPLAQCSSVTLAQLAEQPFIIRELGSGTREVTEEALQKLQIDITVALELGSTEAIKQAVAEGVGVAIVSRAAIVDQLALRTLVILPIPELIIHRQLCLLQRIRQEPSAAMRAFQQIAATG